MMADDYVQLGLISRTQAPFSVEDEFRPQLPPTLVRNPDYDRLLVTSNVNDLIFQFIEILF